MPLNFFPKEISQLTRKDKRYRAEILFYDSLKLEASKNNESIYVYWNVEYLHEHSIKPGECDFIVPNAPVLYHDPKYGGWIDPYEFRVKPKKKEKKYEYY